MNIMMKRLCLGAAFCALAGVAGAADLKIVEVAARDVDCIFQPGCAAVQPENFQDLIDVPGASGVINLRSQTFAGKPGTPAEGKTGYQYRVDLTQAKALGDVACIIDLHVNFGPVMPYRYDAAGADGHVFVITKGIEPPIGLESAVQNGDVITFTFTQPVCTDEFGKGQVSATFGLTASNPSRFLVVKAGVPGTNHIDVKAMVPAR